MIRVPLAKIEPGMRLARPIEFSIAGEGHVLDRDQAIPPDLARRLIEAGLSDVWVRCRELEQLEALIDEELRDQSRDVYDRMRASCQAVARHESPVLGGDRLERAVEGLLGALRAGQDRHLVERLQGFDNPLAAHSTNVCSLALVLALRSESYVRSEHALAHGGEPDLRDLAVGCLLHDVGKMCVPPEVLEKPGALSAEEESLVREHTAAGHAMVTNQVSHDAADIVLGHHRRWDGSGYPQLPLGRGNGPAAGRVADIPVFVRLATIADVYDAATSARCYAPAKLPVQALREIRHSHGFFDPRIVQAFLEIIPPFPIGQVVMLSDGRAAAVVDFNPVEPTRPRVKCLRSPRGERLPADCQEEIDLSRAKELQIVAVDGVDVRPYLE